MNFVDVSRATLDTEWRQLMTSAGIAPDDLGKAVSEERGEPLTVDEFSPEQLTEARERTAEMVGPWMTRPFKVFFNYKCPNWDVTDKEIEDLCGIWSRVFAKHFPTFYQNPIAQKIETFVEGIGLEAEAAVMTWRFFKKREGIPPKVPQPKPGKTNGAGSTAESNQKGQPDLEPEPRLPSEI